MREIKRILRRCGLPAVSLLLAASAAACSEPSELREQEERRQVALILRMKQGDYWNTMRLGAEAAAKEFNVELAYDAPEVEGDVPRQMLLVNQAIYGGADALVIAAENSEALRQAMEVSAQKQAPVVAVDTETDITQAKSFIGINNYEAGRQAGRKLVELIDKSGRVAIISSEQGTRNVELREQGVRDELALHPLIVLLEAQYCTSGRTLCRSRTEELVDRYRGVDGIVALTETASLGAAEALLRLGLDGQVKMMAFGSIPEELDMLQDGVIDATLIQNPFNIGYLGVKHAVEAMSGKQPPRRTETDTKIIDLENMFWADNQKLLFPFVQ
jgi:ribose transport system substrate-binding protein